MNDTTKMILEIAEQLRETGRFHAPPFSVAGEADLKIELPDGTVLGDRTSFAGCEDIYFVGQKLQARGLSFNGGTGRLVIHGDAPDLDIRGFKGKVVLSGNFPGLQADGCELVDSSLAGNYNGSSWAGGAWIRSRVTGLFARAKMTRLKLVDLEHLHLRAPGADFRHVDFGGVSGSDLVNVPRLQLELPGAVLDYARLDGHDLTRCAFDREASIRHASLVDCSVSGMTLGFDLRDSDLRDLDGTKADWTGTDIRGSKHIDTIRIDGATGWDAAITDDEELLSFQRLARMLGLARKLGS